jgi:hypothetical protein
MKKPGIPHNEANGKKVRRRVKDRKEQSSTSDDQEFKAPGREVRK